ncbi:MAG: serine hydrolase [Tepidanaerobacteraceae bacterium]|nr:serine hydrolase [Tepidanaerobacteraceae bacterium]
MKINEAEIEKIGRKFFSESTPGMALLIGEKGRVLYEKGFGMADIEKSIPIEPDTAFIIASVTKQFTTMAIMMLKEKGLLDYDDTIDKYFPDFPDYKNIVTIRHLMTHTSGIKEYFDDYVGLPIEDPTQDDILNWIKSVKALDFEPNTQYSYSNSGYVMLGAIIEMVSRQSFGDFLAENIFIPLDMTRTVVGVMPNQKVDKMASGYKKNEKDSFIKTSMDMMAIGWADGNIISTVQDLFKWHNALYTEKLVKSKTLQEAFTPHVLKDGTKTDYGFGWKINLRPGLKEIWHTGGTIGYICKFSRFVDEDVAIIMLTNRQDLAKEKRDELFDKIAVSVFGEKLYK